MIMIPQLIEASQESQNAYEIYEESSYDDALHTQRREEWMNAIENANNLSFSMRLSNSGSLISLILVIIVHSSSKPKNEGD